MTSQELRALRERYEVTAEELAAAMGHHQHVTLIHMESGSRKITPAAEEKVRRALRRIWKVRQLARLAAKEMAAEIGRIVST